VNPKADLAALGSAMNYLAACSLMAGLAFLFPGFEAKGRSFEEFDEQLQQPSAVKVRAT
jgi:hypothetical protein